MKSAPTAFSGEGRRTLSAGIDQTVPAGEPKTLGNIRANGVGSLADLLLAVPRTW
jgi:hypothetical protein